MLLESSNKKSSSNRSRGGSRTAATSKIELFVIIVNGFQALTIITKCYILDVAAVLDPPLRSRSQLVFKCSTSMLALYKFTDIKGISSFMTLTIRILPLLSLLVLLK